MLKLIIADDEKYEREGLKNNIDWENIGIEILGLAQNGNEALEIAKKDRPDILLTDIRMPVMDGLTLGREIRGLYPDIKIIIISAYEDFSYAKTAIDLNIEEYILKPINIFKFTEMITNLVHKCIEEKKLCEEREKSEKQLKESLPLLKENFYKDLLFGASKDDVWFRSKAEFLGLDLKTGPFVVAVGEIDDYEELVAEYSEKQKYLLSQNIRNSINDILVAGNSGILVALSESRFGLILDCLGNMEQYETLLHHSNICELIVEHVFSKNNIGISFGVGKPRDSLSKINDSYKEAIDSLKQKFYFGKRCVINYNDIGIMGVAHIIDAKEIENSMVDLLKTGDIDRINDAIENLFESMYRQKSNESSIKNICMKILNSCEGVLLNMGESLTNLFGNENILWEKILKFETILDIKQWMKNVISVMAQCIDSRKISRNKYLVDKVKEIVERCYNEKITLVSISKEVFLTPNYISMIFKEEAGIGLNEYLTAYRIQKAKDFLANPVIKVNEIAEMVGYNSVAHFSTIFKNNVGLSPSEYREYVVKNISNR